MASLPSNRASDDYSEAKPDDQPQIDNEKAAPDAISTEIPVEELAPVPEGGARGWFVATGAACVVFCSLGFANSFGTLEQYYLTHQLADQSPSKVAWIGSMTLFLQWVSGMIGGPMFDRYGQKALWAPAVAYIFALMMLSLCYEYWHFMLVQGVLIGVSTGAVQFPAFAASSHYFERKRGLAIGLVVSGSSIGGIIFPIALSKMLNDSSLGFGWSIRVVGFMVMPLLLFSCVVIKARLPPRKSQFFLWGVYKERLFMTLIASLFFIFAGMFMPFFYLPTFAVMKGMDATQAGYLPAVVNGASTVGRIGLGLIADKYGRLNMFAVTALSTAVVVFCMSSIQTQAGFYAYAVFFGLGSGSVISSASTCFSLCPKDPRNIGTYLGMGLALAGFGSLIGPPVDGAMIKAYDSFFQVSMLSGSLCLFGGILAICTKATSSQGLFSRY